MAAAVDVRPCRLGARYCCIDELLRCDFAPIDELAQPGRVLFPTQVFDRHPHSRFQKGLAGPICLATAIAEARRASTPSRAEQATGTRCK